jgi:hypothetical protein
MFGIHRFSPFNFYRASEAGYIVIECRAENHVVSANTHAIHGAAPPARLTFDKIRQKMGVSSEREGADTKLVAKMK